MSWAPTTTTRGTPEITIDWVKENKDSKKFALVDCREKNEWDAGHIDGALFIPLSDFATGSASLDEDTPVVVYCRSGVRSMRATNFLLSKGMKAASMTGGYLGWEAQK